MIDLDVIESLVNERHTSRRPRKSATLKLAHRVRIINRSDRKKMHARRLEDRDEDIKNDRLGFFLMNDSTTSMLIHHIGHGSLAFGG